MLNTRTQKFPLKPHSTLKLYSVENLSGMKKISFYQIPCENNCEMSHIGLTSTNKKIEEHQACLK